MLKGIIGNIKSAAASFIARYLARASVAMSFLIALGLFTVAIGLELTERFGVTNALWILGVGFCVIGLISSVVVEVKEQQDTDVAEEQQSSNEEGIGPISSAAAMQAVTHLPALLGVLLQSPSTWTLPAARLVGRNIPLAILLLFIAVLLWPTGQTEEEGAEQQDDSATAEAGGQEVQAEERFREAA